MKISQLFKKEPYHFKLKCGMDVYLIEDASQTTFIQLDIAFGSIDTHVKYDQKDYHFPAGTAHFLEHKMFAMPDGDGFSYFSQMGVQSNAMTTYRQTSYTLSGVYQMEEALKYLLEMIDLPHFTDENVDAERRIILEELKMYEDDVANMIQQKLLDQMIYTHPIKDDIVGTKKSLHQLSKETLFDAHEIFYAPSNRQLLISGPIDISKYEALLKTYDAQVSWPKKTFRLIKQKEVSALVKSFDETTMDVYASKFGMGIKMPLPSTDERAVFKYEMQIVFLLQLLLGANSTFFQKLLDAQIVVDQFNMFIVTEDQYGLVLMENMSEKLPILTQKMKDIFLKDGKKQLKKAGFERLKRAYLGSYIIALDDFENKLYLYGKYLLHGLKLNEAIETMMKLTFEEVCQLYDQLKEEMFTFLHIQPNTFM